MAEKPSRAKFAFITAEGASVPLAQAAGIVVEHDGRTAAIMLRGFGDNAQRMFAIYGMLALAQAAAKGANAPISEIGARLSGVTETAWGDEKPVKPPKPKRDPLGELVEIIRGLKGPTWDEAAFRAKCEAEPGFKLAARKVPEVAAEIARRKAADSGAEPAPGLGAL